MYIGPALGIGGCFVLIVAFVIGYILTLLGLQQFADWRKFPPYIYNWLLRRGLRPGAWSQDQLHRASIAGGGVCVVIVIAVVLLMPVELRVSLFPILTVLGIIAGLATFVIRFLVK